MYKDLEAPVAQRPRAVVSKTHGRGFESHREHQIYES